MAPGPKRKRGDRTYSQDDSQRPSPHRPHSLPHAHFQHQNSPRGGRGGVDRRQSRGGGPMGGGGRGASSVPQSPNFAHASPPVRSPVASAPQPPSRPTPAAPPTPAPPKETVSIPAAPTGDVPASNEYLTPQRVARWNHEARQAVIEAALAAQRGGDALTLSVVFHEIIEASIYRQLDSGDLGSLVRDIVATSSDALVDPVSIFLDTLSCLTEDEEKQRLVRPMLMATEIDVEQMRTELDAGLLKQLELVRPSFNKMAVRKATHALYRQSNYNLLREESEGYSKLMTEYFTTVNSEPPSHEVVSETYQRVNALIGAFDLDIGRVLDVTLDVFANLLVKHGKFFVKLLRSSAWWPEQRGLEGIEWEEPEVATLPKWAQPKSPTWYYSEEEKLEQLQQRERRDRKFWDLVGSLEASRKGKGIEAFYELGARRITANNRPRDEKIHAEGATLSDQQAARKWADDWMSQTGTLPPSGNDTAAQLLGFKLQFYASDARDATDFLPDNLIHLAALLIKVGFISILDLYPHLYPPEEDMSAHHRKLVQAKKEKEEKESGKDNALTMSVLTDDSALGPPVLSRLRDAEKPARSESESGASAPGEAPSARPSLPEPADQKYQLLKSLLCIGALPEALFILGLHPWLLEVYPDLLELVSRLAHHSISTIYEAARPIPPEQIPVVSKGSGVRPSDFVHRRTLRWPKPDQKDAGDGIDYRFYWEDWSDNVPVCQNVDDMIKLCTTLLGLVGPDCGQDTVLLTKIARIARKDFADDPSDANRQRWIKFSTTFLCPSLSFTGQNPGVVNEVWELLKQFDTATRFTIYEQWQVKAGTKPTFRHLFKKINTATSKELNKVTTTNVKESGRKIAKISYSNPGIVFKNIVTRLIGYPNMIDALVECSKYITLLGYDVLTWTLVTTLVNSSREGKKGDGMFAQGWLTNLSLFIGRAYQRYALLDPTPVLQYTTHQLLQSSGDLYMLDVLEQIIKLMGGIGPTGSLSESIVLSLSAGPVLRAYTLQHNLADNRHQAASSAKRLAKCLKDKHLASQILVALAQHVEAFIHRDDMLDAPDKVVFFNADKLYSNLFQYLEFLRAYISEEDFDASFPGLIEMISDYRVDPTIAFTICRASIAAKANSFRIEQQGKATDGDVTMEGAEGTSTANDAAADKDVDMEVAKTGSEVTSAGTNRVGPANAEIEKVAEQLRGVLPETFADHPCLSFYVTFWQLSLQDVDQFGIKERYREIIQTFQRQAAPVHTERRYNSRIPKQDTPEQRRAKEEITKLNKERDSFTKVAQATQEQLRVEMSRWFADAPAMGPQSDALHFALLQDCFIPRSRMSLHDAQYTFAMLQFMHKSGSPGFRTIKLLDFLFVANKLSALIGMYSEEESKNFGRFLNDILRELQKWHDNKSDAYAKNAYGEDKKLPGFGRKFDANRKPEIHLDYNDFCHVLFKWHKALCTALKACIESGKFSEIRNAISVLNAVSSSFPKVDTMRDELQAPLERIAKEDERNDLKISAQSTFRIFKQGKAYWRTEWQYRNQKMAPPEDANGTSKTGSQTPQPKDAPVSKLSASAPVFKSRHESNGTPKPAESTDDDAQQGGSTPATPATRPNDREATQATTRESDVRDPTPSHQERGNTPARGTPGPSVHTSSVSSRPDNRPTQNQGLQTGRASHALPIRPDSQPPRPRPSDRQSDYGPPQGRYDNRIPPNDYGRLERPIDPRERVIAGGRTPERGPGPVDRRDYNRGDPRDYEDRSMRAPPRDPRGPPIRGPPQWEQRDPRDLRDPRDHRERLDHRGHPVPSTIEPRRAPSSSSMSQEYGSHQRDLPPSRHQGPDRPDFPPSRPPPGNLSTTTDGPAINPARAALIDPAVNPARAALINESGPPRHESRSDRDGRRERGSHPQSPNMADDRRGIEPRGEDRRGDDRGHVPHHVRSEAPRDYREERMPPQGPPSNRDRREEMSVNSMPTGPRGPRNEPPRSENSNSLRGSREMFQPSQSIRQSNNQSQDPNYGRLNAPSEPAPSGPRNDRREMPSQPPPASAPSGPSAANPNSLGVHPSRQVNFGGNRPNAPPIQTDMSGAPSGPRGGRTPQGPLPSPGARGPPTGPAFNNDRVPRNPNPLRAINSVLNQNAPSPTERNAPVQSQGPPVTVRGRGANRANEPNDGQNSHMPPPQYVTTPSARPEGPHPRSERPAPPGQTGGEPQEERSESRSRRTEGRREERSGRERDHEKRSEDRSSRNGPSQRGEPGQEQERGSDRERREKRGSDRESSRRHGEREGERSSREGGERSGREPREPREARESKPHRSSRESGRPSGSGREERDRSSRSGGGSTGDDARKRVRDPADQPHGDMKRRR
ncbi:transcription factor/nuclear export subunit protein 2-domain-containing protein [Boeremia exigua]|uniref:transcription factor/nuclear export subunit protein 2-domain-containing protein n=1 Tax=Boeremia exigua TaxID=749465 RepID=UPI001E8E2995|nr:transcription factor/nuclear export subunit protein 2-domain-containing protein [Boeremia exigua]KAH6622281.1 transcription factor/nuclear export subunit protein 2-domain-containing protein [Boeremia exigua]